jgi:asparagine synthase (glutamine-hydrolysing)
MGEGNETILREMVEAIKHRGPDSQGVEIIKNVGLGHARLAILDLSASGHQPMWNEDKTIGLVFNGEIYNFKEIRDKLKKKHIFQSQTDTEVLIHAYEEKGEAIFSELRGMFAIAFYDVKKDEIILARDHVGKKPMLNRRQE